jgi:hypothetical protein
MNSNSKGLPYAVKQEICNPLAIHCQNIVIGEKSDGDTSKGQNVLCEKVFLSETAIGLVTPKKFVGDDGGDSTATTGKTWRY